MVRTEARIISLKILRKMSFPGGLYVLIRFSTPLAMALRFTRPRMPPIRILTGSFFHSMNAESIDRDRRIIIDCLNVLFTRRFIIFIWFSRYLVKLSKACYDAKD